MPDIVLATLNARHVHASLGLRYLHANLGELASRARIREFVLGAGTADLVETLLADSPLVVGFGVYIWNVEETTRAVAMLKRIAPEVCVVVGGPEVSFEIDGQRICALADYVVTGQADLAFADLCRRVLAGDRLDASSTAARPICRRSRRRIRSTPTRTCAIGFSMSKPRAAARFAASSVSPRSTRLRCPLICPRCLRSWLCCTIAVRGISVSSIAPST